jgi:5'-3' exonuclease
VWPMIEFEADDALASAAALAAQDHRVERVIICTPDKDLAQCIHSDCVVQLDRCARTTIDVAGVIAKFGVGPASIPDYLALVGDAADGFPGLRVWGAKSTAAVLAKFRHLFRDLATLRADIALFDDVDELRWARSKPEFTQLAKRLDAGTINPSDAKTRRSPYMSIR